MECPAALNSTRRHSELYWSLVVKHNTAHHQGSVLGHSVVYQRIFQALNFSLNPSWPGHSSHWHSVISRLLQNICNILSSIRKTIFLFICHESPFFRNLLPFTEEKKGVTRISLCYSKDILGSPSLVCVGWTTFIFSINRTQSESQSTTLVCLTCCDSDNPLLHVTQEHGPAVKWNKQSVVEGRERPYL